MINRLLMAFGYTLVSTDALARRLAGRILDTHYADVYTLERTSTERMLQVEYMRIAVESGLPPEIARGVAERAWRYIAAAQRDPLPVDDTPFSFYE